MLVGQVSLPLLEMTAEMPESTTAIRIAAVSLGDLRKSTSEIERRAAEALESHLKQQG